MAWAKRPTAAKYRTREHRNLRAHYVRRLKAGEVLTCTICKRAITNPNGRAPDGLHLGHNDDGITYAGPQHNMCNVRDGAKRGNARSHGQAPRWVI